jgi:hypothetical protein
MDNLIKKLRIENRYAELIDCGWSPNGLATNPTYIAFAEGVTATLKVLIKWLYSACPHGIGDFHDKDKAVTMSFRIDCPECRKDLERIIDG